MLQFLLMIKMEDFSEENVAAELERVEAIINNTDNASSLLLDSVISCMCSSGLPELPWDLVQRILQIYLNKILSKSLAAYINTLTTNDTREQQETISELESEKEILLENLSAFEAAPFTLQRICEILLNSEQFYPT